MSPEEQKIYQEFSDCFRNAMSEDDRLARFAQKLTKGEATYVDAWDYARRVGGQMSDALLEVAEEILLSEDGYNIVMSALHDGYQEAAEYAAEVQTTLNKEAGIGIRGVKPDFMKGRASGIAHKASNAEDLETTEYYLGSPAQHFTENVVGDTIKANEEFQYRSGLNPKIKRTAVGGCCEWCQAVAGEYDYPVSDEIYRRHANCDCLVEYYPGNGLKQNAHTKRWRRDKQRQDGIQRRTTDFFGEDGRRFEPDIIIGKSVHAAFKDTIIRMPDGTETRLTPGTRITKVQVIAGLGRTRQIDEIDILMYKYPDTEEYLWQKKKGFGYVDFDNESRLAELHFYENKKVGRVDWKVKPKPSGEWFYDED